MTQQAEIRGVIYCRKSNEDKEDSVTQQETWAKQILEEEGITLAHRPFIDQAKKGWETATRDEFHAMLEFAEFEQRQGRRVHVVICWDTDRFSRSDSNETGSFIWRFRQCGTSRMLTKTDGWLDFNRAEHRLLFNGKQDMMNHQYVRNLAQNSTRGRIASALEGRFQGGDIPYGYRGEKELVTKKGVTKEVTARLVLGPDNEVEVVRTIFRQYAEGFGQRYIAEQLNTRGIPSPKKGLWGVNTIKGMLLNPVYLGRLIWARRRQGKFFAVIDAEVTAVPDDGTAGRNLPNPEKAWIRANKDQTHDPIISLETWNACQAQRKKRQKERRPRMGVYALSGLAICGNCNVNMVARVKTVREKDGAAFTYRLVQCGSYNRSGKTRCSYNAVDADSLTNAVWDKLYKALTHPNIELAVCEEVCRRKEMAQTNDQQHVASLRAKLAGLEKKVQYTNSLCCDPENKAIFASLREELLRTQQERNTIKSELEALEQKPQPVIDYDAEVQRITDFLERLPEMNDDERKEVLRNMVASVVLFFDQEDYGKPSKKTGKLRTRSHFARGGIYLHPGLLADIICQQEAVPSDYIQRRCSQAQRNSLRASS